MKTTPTPVKASRTVKPKAATKAKAPAAKKSAKPKNVKITTTTKKISMGDKSIETKKVVKEISQLSTPDVSKQDRFANIPLGEPWNEDKTIHPGIKEAIEDAVSKIKVRGEEPTGFVMDGFYFEDGMHPIPLCQEANVIKSGPALKYKRPLETPHFFNVVLTMEGAAQHRATAISRLSREIWKLENVPMYARAAFEREGGETMLKLHITYLKKELLNERHKTIEDHIHHENVAVPTSKECGIPDLRNRVAYVLGFSKNKGRLIQLIYNDVTPREGDVTAAEHQP